jgi:hypothetical protein
MESQNKNKKIPMPQYRQMRIIYAIIIPILLVLYMFKKADGDNWPAIIAISLIIIALGYEFFAAIINKKARAGYEDWAKQKKLNYLEKIKINFFSVGGGAKIRDVIWGELNGKRIVVFNSTNRESNANMFGYADDEKLKIFSRHLTSVDGEFYNQISSDEIERVILGNSTEKSYDLNNFFKSDMIATEEVILLIVALVYLKTGKFIEYKKAYQINKLMWKLGIIKNNTYDSLESQALLESKLADATDKGMVKDMLDIYKELHKKYNPSFF